VFPRDPPVNRRPSRATGRSWSTQPFRKPVVGQPGRQAARSAPDLEHPGGVGRDRGDIGRDACEKRAEQEPAEGVAADGIASEDACWHLVPSGGVAAASQDRQGCGGRSGQDDETSSGTC
jgi:hypothetical protein